MDPHSLFPDVDRRLKITIHNMPARGTYVFAVFQFQLLVDISAAGTLLAGREPFIHPDKFLPLSPGFVLEHLCEHAPAVVGYRFAEAQRLLERVHIQVFYADDIVFVGQFTGKFVQRIFPLMLGFRMELSNTQLLLLVIPGSL